MRIVAGRHKGRPINAPHGRNTRPTADRARETLFNVLGHGYLDLEDVEVLDVFAGSGALGLEALSRGARHAWFIDHHATAAEIIRTNLRLLGESDNATVLHADATRPPPAPQPCGLVLLDPPYGCGLAGRALTALDAKGWLAEDVLCVVEVAAKEDFTPPAGFAVAEERVCAAARFIFLQRKA